MLTLIQALKDLVSELGKLGPNGNLALSLIITLISLTLLTILILRTTLS